MPKGKARSGMEKAEEDLVRFYDSAMNLLTKGFKLPKKAKKKKKHQTLEKAVKTVPIESLPETEQLPSVAEAENFLKTNSADMRLENPSDEDNAYKEEPTKYGGITYTQPYHETEQPQISPLLPGDEAKAESLYEVDLRLKKEGYTIKSKTEHDLDEIKRSKEPNPTGDKEDNYKTKTGIPRYFGK